MGKAAVGSVGVEGVFGLVGSVGVEGVEGSVGVVGVVGVVGDVGEIGLSHPASNKVDIIVKKSVSARIVFFCIKCSLIVFFIFATTSLELFTRTAKRHNCSA